MKSRNSSGARYMTSAEILIVDDHQIVREGVRSLLATLRPAWTVSEAPDGPQAMAMIRNAAPDLVIMDITMPGLSGFEVASRLRKSGFNRPILMFTMHKSAQLKNEAQEAGTQGYVVKSQAVEDLVRAIDALLAGGTFFGPENAPHGAPSKPVLGIIFFRALAPGSCW